MIFPGRLHAAARYGRITCRVNKGVSRGLPARRGEEGRAAARPASTAPPRACRPAPCHASRPRLFYQIPPAAVHITGGQGSRLLALLRIRNRCYCPCRTHWAGSEWRECPCPRPRCPRCPRRLYGLPPSLAKAWSAAARGATAPRGAERTAVRDECVQLGLIYVALADTNVSPISFNEVDMPLLVRAQCRLGLVARSRRVVQCSPARTRPGAAWRRAAVQYQQQQPVRN